MQQDLVLCKWSVYPYLDDSGKDELSESELLSSIPKILKRRLSPLARIVFCAINQCIGENKHIPIVFSSTHGELAKSFRMMEMIENGEEISPTAFSLSVHNAIAGLFSIVYKNRLQSVVLAAGEEGIGVAFIEATGLLKEGHNEVIIVFYDEPLVDFYPSAPYRLSTETSRAVAIKIKKKGVGIPLQFSCFQDTGNDGEQAVQIPLLVRFLSTNQDQLVIQTPRHSWSWKKNESYN